MKKYISPELVYTNTTAIESISVDAGDLDWGKNTLSQTENDPW